jgi:hypothetical protein
MSRIILAGTFFLVGASWVVAGKSDEVAVIRPSAVDRPAPSSDDVAVEAKLTEIWTEYESRIESINSEIEGEFRRLRVAAQKKGDIEEVNLWDERGKQWEATGQIKYEPKAQNDNFAKFLRERTDNYSKARETLEKNHNSLVANVLKRGDEDLAKELNQMFDAVEPHLPPPRVGPPPRRIIPGLPNGRYRSDYTNGWSLELTVEGDSVAVIQSGFNGGLQPPPGPVGGVFKNTTENAYMIDIGPWHEVWFIGRDAGGRNIKVQHWKPGAERRGPPTNEGVANRVAK